MSKRENAGIIFEGAYYRTEVCVSKSVWLDNKNSFKH